MPLLRFLSGMILVLTGFALAQSPPVETARGPLTRNVVNPAPIETTSNNRAPAVPDMPPLPTGATTLLGGTIRAVDHVRDRLTVEVFGGGLTPVLFDERTQVFRDGKKGSVDDLRRDQRVYIDTMLDGTKVFARNIRLSEMPTGQSSGQIVEFNSGSDELTVRDRLSPEPVKLRLAAGASILRGDQTAAASELRPGTLVNLTFAPGSGGLPSVRQISILASPGADFAFSGTVEYLDLARGMIVLRDPRDNKTYEVSVDSTAHRLTRDLRQGTSVTVRASFDGAHYQAREITVNTTAAKQ